MRVLALLAFMVLATHVSAQQAQGVTAESAQIGIGIVGTVIAVIALISSLWTAIAGIRTTRAQTRAYVHIESAELKWGNDKAGKPTITLWAKNTGQTPARWFSVVCRVFARELNEDGTAKEVADFKVVNLLGRSAKRWNALGAQSDLSFPAYNPDDISIMREAYGTNVSLNIAGTLRYETFFGEIFETEFWFSRRPVPAFKFAKVGPNPLGVGMARYGVPEEPHKMQRVSCVLRAYVHIRKRWWRKKPHA